jgi:hypothetical protein
MPGLLRRWSLAALAATTLLVLGAAAAPRAEQRAPQPPAPDVLVTLDRATARVKDFFERAQSLVCTEKVYVQPLNSSLTGDGFGRTIESELRLAWDPAEDGHGAAEATALRRVMRVNGRTPRKKDRNNCTTEERNEVAPQPLSMLLDAERGKYTFTHGGAGRLDGREVLLLDFREIEKAKGEVSTHDDDEDCLSFQITGGSRGRLWVDTETHDVLRLDQHLSYVELKLSRALLRRPGAQQDATLDRYDTSYRFKRVTFENPPETIVLPVSYTHLMVTRGSAAVRTRRQTTYSNYQRFLTGGRLVPGPAPQ